MVQLDQSPSEDRTREMLMQRKIAWLASIHPSGRPHIVPVWFLLDQNDIYILSRPRSQKNQNLRANPHCSLAIDDSNDGHEPVALDGIATLEDAPLEEELSRRYIEKYGQMLDEMHWTPEHMFAEHSQVVRVVPTKFLSIT